MKIQVTLQDIADKAGVSRTTVSLALRNHAGLPPVTRAHIQQIAHDLGYRPNPLVSTLMSYQRAARSDRPKHLTLAFVLRFSRSDSWQDYLAPELISGAAERARQFGYQLEEFWLDDLKMDGTRLSQVLSQRGVPGVLLAPLPVAAGHFRLDWDRFSAVALGYSMARPELHRVTTDFYETMLLAIRELKRRGYRRLGLALETGHHARVHHQWGAAFVWEQRRDRPGNRVPLWVVDRCAWNAERFAAWYLEHRPDAILTHDAGVYSWLTELGVKVPREVGCAHLANPQPSGEMSGLYYDPAGIGGIAVDLLVSLIHRNDRGIPRSPQVTQLGATWVDGKTIRPLPGKIFRMNTSNEPFGGLPDHPLSETLSETLSGG